MVPVHARAVLKPPQGHLVDCLRRARGDPRGPLVIRVPQEVKDDLGVHCMDPGSGGPSCRVSKAATSLRSGTVPKMATAQVGVRSAARAKLVVYLQGPPPDASEEVWSQASGIQSYPVGLSHPR